MTVHVVRADHSDMHNAESEIALKLSELPGAPYSVQVGFDPESGHYRIETRNQVGLNYSYLYPALNEDVIKNFVLVTKGNLYDAPPLIDVEALDKDIAKLKANNDRLKQKIATVELRALGFEELAAERECKLAKIKATLGSTWKPNDE